MNSIRSKAIVLIRRLLRSIYAHKLYSYPSLRKLLMRFSDSKSAAVHLGDALPKQVIIVFDGREQLTREAWARPRSKNYILARQKFSLSLELSSGM